MEKREKTAIVERLTAEFSNTPHIYFTDPSAMPVQSINALRRLCHSRGIRYEVIKNTLIRKSLEKQTDRDFSPLFSKTLRGCTGVLFEQDTPNACARLLQDFHKKTSTELPALKAACIVEDLYIEGIELNTLAKMKSKNELIAELIGLLKAPATQVVSMLLGQRTKLANLLESLAKREK